MRQPTTLVYLVLAVLGAILPCVFFVDWFAAGGTLAGFLPAAFANGVTAGLTADLLVSSLVFWVLAFADSRRRGAGAPWPFVAVNLAIGLSCALPLYLWWRSREVEPGARLSLADGGA